MPVLASIYAVLLCVVAFDSVYDNFKARKPAYYVLMDAVSDFAMVFLFIGHWVSSLVRSIGWGAPCLFFACLLWTLSTLPWQMKEAKRAFDVEDGLLFERFRGFIYGALALLLLPSYWFGGLAAFEHYVRT